MSSHNQILPLQVGGRTSGPQGTLLFSADDLQQYARETEARPDGRASVHEPVLEGINEGVKGLRLSLSAGRKSIGRSPNNDLIVDHLSVSAAHAWIINHHGRCAVVNTLSTNGTFVNDKRIHEAILKPNDHVRFGQAEFVFLPCEPDPASAPSHSIRPHWILAGSVMAVLLAAVAWWLI